MNRENEKAQMSVQASEKEKRIDRELYLTTYHSIVEILTYLRRNSRVGTYPAERKKDRERERKDRTEKIAHLFKRL